MNVLEAIYWGIATAGLCCSALGFPGLRFRRNPNRVKTLMEPLNQYDLKDSGALSDLIADQLEADCLLSLGALFLFVSLVLNAAGSRTELCTIPWGVGVVAAIAGVATGFLIKCVVRNWAEKAAQNCG